MMLFPESIFVALVAPGARNNASRCCISESIDFSSFEQPSETIKAGPRRKESDCGETRHCRSHEQENAYRSESSRLTPDSDPHGLNIGRYSSP
jgi:hypothetical protein